MIPCAKNKCIVPALKWNVVRHEPIEIRGAAERKDVSDPLMGAVRNTSGAGFRDGRLCNPSKFTEEGPHGAADCRSGDAVCPVAPAERFVLLADW